MNQEQQLQAIRERWGKLLQGAYPGPVHQDIATLLRMIDERDAIIHDLMIDGSHLARRAVEEFAFQVLQVTNNHFEHHRKQMAVASNAEEYTIVEAQSWVASLIGATVAEMARAGGQSLDPLPPDQARAEAERLRGKLRVIQAKVAEFQDLIGNYGSGWPGVESALNRLQELAKENT